jgi:hypothetical protein
MALPDGQPVRKTADMRKQIQLDAAVSGLMWFDIVNEGYVRLGHVVETS